MKSNIGRISCLAAVMALVAVACGDSGATTTTAATTTTPATTTTAATTTTEGHDEGEEIHLEAAPATVTVDGDDSDWASITGADVELEAISTETVESKHATIKVAYDDTHLYVLLTVEDDFDWDAADAHLSASTAVMWAVEEAAGPHMGTDVEGEEEDYTSLGMVDIWHWELECAIGTPQGGEASDAGDGEPGNDAGCNFDDEWATDPENREDDNGEGAENSLLGVFGHTNPVAGGDGTWIFEMRRPLDTGDLQDAQFAVGTTALMAIAYWDPDNSPEGWDDAEHVQSSHLGWIEVTLVAG
jgi:hypothetical protein